MSSKGSQNERELATTFSQWWQPGRQDIFWRILGSGSRSTNRFARGMTTYGSAGDIAAVDPIGTPFVEMFTVEAKKGYPTTHANPFEAIDRIKPLKPTKQNFDGWIVQVEKATKQAATPYWMIVFQRYRRRQMACMPTDFMLGGGPLSERDRSMLRMARTATITKVIAGQDRALSFFPLEYLLKAMTPSMVRRAHERMSRT